MLKAILIVVSVTSAYLSAEHNRGMMGQGGMGMGGYGAGMGNGYGMGMGQGGMGMMGQGGGMGMGGMMGGGGGGQSSYESKREEISKTFEQPAQESQKKIQELTKETIAQNQKAFESTNAFFKSLEPKDVKLDDSTVKSLSAAEPAAESKAIAESTKDMLEQIARAGETTAKLAAEQAKAQAKALQARNEVLEEDASATLLTLGKKIESFAGLASADRSPASTPQAAAMGTRGFAGAHNPPAGL